MMMIAFWVLFASWLAMVVLTLRSQSRLSALLGEQERRLEEARP